MEKVKNFLIKWIFPPGIIHLRRNIIRRMKKNDTDLSVEYKEILSKNYLFKNIAKNKRAFLLATGPSINQSDLRVLKDEDCFSVSNFFLHKDIEIINPKFHFFAPYHKPLILENFIEWLVEADKLLPKKTKIFLGLKDIELVKKYNIFSDRKVFYMQFGNVPYKNIDLTKITPVPQTSPLMVLNALLYMGYKKVYLLGCDHNTLKDYGKNKQNFYSSEKEKRKNATDFKSWHEIDKELLYHLKVFQSYREILANNDIELINLSKDSWLDFIKRQDLVEIISNESGAIS